MDEPRAGPGSPPDAPLLQRLYDRPFLLLVVGMVIMLIVYTFWGLWEIASLPQAPLP
jgi:hypothetical protein